MGVLDSFGAESGTADFLPKAEQPIPTTGFFTNMKAGFKGAFAGPSETNLHQNLYEKPYYDQIVAALNARGERTVDPLKGGGQSSAREFRNPISASVPLVAMDDPIGWGAREGESIWQAVARARQADPNFLKDLDSTDAIRAKAQADRQRDSREAQSVNDRATTLGSVGFFLGGIAGAPFEPSSYAGGGVGGLFESAAGKTVGRQILKAAAIEGSVNAAAATLASPLQAADARHNLKSEMTAGDITRSAGEQFAFGAILGGGHVAAPHLIAKGGKAANDLFDAAISALPPRVKVATMSAAMRAGTVNDRALALWARGGLGVGTDHDIATPAERQALHVVERDADVREASPFHAAPAPDATHETRLSAVMKSLDIPERSIEVPSPAPVPARTGSIVDQIIKRESGGNPNARAATSSASGLGQFTDSTWLGVVRKHGLASGGDADLLALKSDARLGRAATEAYVSDNAAALRRAGFEDSAGNIYLAHFLGEGGAKSVLRADPSTPIERLNPQAVAANSFLKGKSAADVIAWAHKRMGDASGLPVARGDAVGGVDPRDIMPDSLPAYETASFRPDEVETDAGLMQYKSGGDASGVTDRLAGVTEWNPILSGKAVVWEDAGGRRVVVDGHQRLGLARRLATEDPNVRLDAVVLREADGVSAQQARVWGALKNIAEGSGDAVDAARVLREAPVGFQLPPRSPLVRTAKGLAGLSNEAFGAVLNNVAQPNLAAQVGSLAPDRPEMHMALLDMIRQSGVTTEGQASSVVRQALADGFGRSSEQQLGMFGEMPQQSLYGPAARILDAAKRQLRQEKRVFSTLTDQAGRIEAAGNVLDRESNQAKVIGNDEAIGILDATAHSAGPVRSALLDAARASLDGDQRVATRQFLDAISSIDLRDAARGLDDGGADGLSSGGAGRARDDPEADGDLADGRGLPGRPDAYTDAVDAGQSSLGFSDPVADAATKQVESLQHDLLMTSDLGDFRLSEDGPERPFATILREADADLDAVEKARACMAPPQVGET
jgi:hypothetical protein